MSNVNISGGKIKKKKRPKAKRVVCQQGDGIPITTDNTTSEQNNIFNYSKNKKRNCDDRTCSGETRKKNKIVPNETEGKKTKSIRQMKREKHAQRQAEAQDIAKDIVKQQSLNYLSQWKHNHSNWKFMKAKQVWLFKNKFSSKLVPDAMWPIALEYFSSAQGNIRKMLLDDASKVVNDMDVWKEKLSENVDNSEICEQSTDIKPNETSYNRSRDIIQHLTE